MNFAAPKTARGVMPGALQGVVLRESKNRAGTVKTDPSGPIYSVVPFHFFHAPHHSAKSQITAQ